jgi:hypothetical protein
MIRTTMPRLGLVHLGGSRPFGWRLGEAADDGKARALVPDPAEQTAIVTTHKLRAAGRSLMQIRDTMRAQGFAISHTTVPTSSSAPPEARPSGAGSGGLGVASPLATRSFFADCDRHHIG